eukprot:CAMPEP_0174701796 /NCGR_PEP_ID=MMETSP1094-20130205/6314_1 /TAXON_ID=156173 /ORGANISM="Chrysochromulina brevifilum, Strain UTEX LB 985" /LENGTH=79 /DNA_ID=CAMNT_0015899491 /DNA_START=280 /DNA_END=516 /DNA_ORIENTATION=+
MGVRHPPKCTHLSRSLLSSLPLEQIGVVIVGLVGEATTWEAEEEEEDTKHQLGDDGEPLCGHTHRKRVCTDQMIVRGGP